MKLTIKQKSLAGIAMLLLILIVTNPDYKKFKQSTFLVSSDYQYQTGNYFIFSKYEAFYPRGIQSYIGIFGNIYKTGFFLSPDKSSKTDTTSLELDTVSSKRNLWYALNKATFYTKPYDEFTKQFSTLDRINKLYLALNKSGYYSKSETDFVNQFFN